jgi:Raf kinase inhibitor-like YbhB/YbcL family protein
MRVLFTLLSATVLSLGASSARAQDTFELTSADVTGGAFKPAQIADTFGCTGGNVSPQLSWRGAPADTKSFVITIYDPDAPTGSGFWHWVVANIPASVSEIPGGASGTANMPAGVVESRTDFGTTGYGGPCPPAGDPPHRYVFTIHAVNVEQLDVAEDAPAALVGFMTHMTRLASASFTARYGR